MAIDSKGNLWVARQGNNRLQKFNEKGEWVLSAGATGSGAGKLSSPSALALDSSGNVWVADTANNRIVEFKENGEFLRTFGTNVNKTKVEAGGTTAEKNLCTAASGNVCQAATAGSAAGQLKSPQGIAVTATSTIWVVDTGNGRLQKFDMSGTYLSSLSSEGTEAGKLKEPKAITIAPDGSLWVADYGNNRIQQWSNPSFVRAVGKEGSAGGEFKGPAAIEADATGNIWVGDQKNNRVEEFDRTGVYLRQFGSGGSGPGQFSLKASMGLTVDPLGSIWITDSGHFKVQRWLIPRFPVYSSSFGTSGTGNGQFSNLADVATDSKGNLWALDKEANRLQKFNEKGEWVLSAGATGSGAGKLSSPSALALDSSGNVWVADTANNRIVEFKENGEFLRTFGTNVNKTKVEAGGTTAEKNLCTAASGNVCQAATAGSAAGQLKSPQGIAVTATSTIWVVDTGNGRLQKFDMSGTYLSSLSSEGTEAGKLKEPKAITIAPDGSLWVADYGNNRIQQWSNSSFVRAVGKEGSAGGEFKGPAAIEADATGNIWVGDQKNNRVEEFAESGKYLGQFGAEVSGKFSFSASMGIAADALGGLWITDGGASRVQKWVLANYKLAQAPPLELSDGDPKVTVETPGGLVSKVSGNAAGTNTYTHVGDDLTAHKGPAGEAKYTYDASGRMTKVTLPNGTWGSVAYQSDGRVKTVTVDPAGSAPSKATTFEYTDSPTRRTVVVPSDTPHVTYDIGEDGSVLKWWNALQPPVFDDLAGGLYENRNKEDGLLPGDQYLDIQAHSEEGIASIDVVVNGNQLAHETTCAQTEAPGIECKTVVSEWVANTDGIPPGHLNIEVVITDRLGNIASERFWVDIPEPPPPPASGTPTPPKFADVLDFREEFGLEKVFPVANEIERNERIWNSINAWYEGEPIARASWERWGVPLRSADVAELEYRQRYVAQAGTAIPNWAQAHAAATYAGYYVDHREGGVIHVGFTDNQAARLAALAGEGGLMAPERLASFPQVPQHSYRDLTDAQAHIGTSPNSLPSLSRAAIDAQGNQVKVGTTGSVQAMEGALDSLMGTEAPVAAYLMPPLSEGMPALIVSASVAACEAVTVYGVKEADIRQGLAPGRKPRISPVVESTSIF